MQKILSLVGVFALSFVATGTVCASGWRIPEQSVDSTGKSGANIASARRADTAYYNPAKMGWMADQWHLGADLTYIHLTAVDYDDVRNDSYDHTSKKENFLVPTGFMVSPDYNGVRFGMAVVIPYGLAKRWHDGYGQVFVEEFSLQVIEVNPTLSYTFGNLISFAAGPRMQWADGTVKSDASVVGQDMSRDMSGQTVEWGWNAAVNIRPMEGLDLAVTYRSYIDLQFSESTSLTLMGREFKRDTELSIPAPAVLAVSVAYDLTDDLTVELTWDRTFWSEYDIFDFDYTPQIPKNPYEIPVIRDWKDSDAFRLGLSYRLTQDLELLAGFAYDKTPAPVETVDFSIPDSDAWMYSLGVQYKINSQLEVGLSALYDYKEDRKRELGIAEEVYGSFSNAAALLVTVGVNYTF